MKLSNDKGVSGDMLLIGEIVGVHGLQGAVKIRSYADSPALFERGHVLQLETHGGQARRLAVAWAKPHGKGILMGIEGVHDRDAAEALVGGQLSMTKASLPDLEDDTYYWFELIGLSVYDTQGRFLGKLATVLPTGSNDVYVVRNGDDEILVPALASVVQAIDTDQRRMEVTLPEGL